ncbi:MAG: D-hexose-6-phosphate mutarotase [Methylobacillus sp.]|jgi:D-hexose-6-phosphate mutarotase|nr:D-hexose-6-phosphate mutarotase [Methylobacillus sp.]
MNTELEQLNARHALGQSLKFSRDPGGLIVAEIENPLASARLSLLGAHLLQWRPRTTSLPVIWYSPKAQLVAGKPPHSGAPVCWPWFGANPLLPDSPFMHGCARKQSWEVMESGLAENGATRLLMRLLPSVELHQQWPYSAQLTLELVIGETLRMTLTTTNTGDQPCQITEALHTYFQVGDVAAARVLGLEDCVYLDKAANFAQGKQQGAVTFSGEVDKIYVDTETECVIEDPALRRQIRIAKSGSASTVVWTPWREKAAAMSDVAEEWPHMLCVESANAAHNAVTLAPGGIHEMRVEYGVSAM